MKKLLALLLVVAMIFICCACTDPTDTSKTAESSEAPAESSEAPAESSEAPAESSEAPAESSAAPAESSEAPAESSEAPAESSEAPEESSTDPAIQLPEFTNKFVAFGAEMVDANALAGSKSAKLVGTSTLSTAANSIRLTKINEAVEYGDIAYINSDYAETVEQEDETFADYLMVVAVWQQDRFNYVFDEFFDAGENSTKTNLDIPADGFVIIAHKDNPESAKLAKVLEDDLLVPVGVPTQGLEVDIIKQGAAPTIDGIVDTSEYGLPIWTVDETNEFWAYSSFVPGDYYSTADVYATWDEENLYLGVVVNSPYHVCKLTQSGASAMWSAECIQVNVMSVAPDSEMVSEYFDWGSATAEMNTYLSANSMLYQFGFGCSSIDGSSLYVIWMGANTTFTGETKSLRNETNQTTTYEAAIPWSYFNNADYPAVAEEGYEFGFAVSVNSTNEQSGWRNIFLRNGGSIIGRNDMSKAAKAILG